MKQIKDYIGKKVAINCATKEEHDKLYDLIRKQGLNYISGSTDCYSSYDSDFCFCIELSNLTYSGLSFFKGNGYTVYPASDFLSVEFVLPKKWYVKVEADNRPKEVYEWREEILLRKGNWYDSGYIDNTGFHSVSKPSSTEITLEQFKEHVLKKQQK